MAACELSLTWTASSQCNCSCSRFARIPLEKIVKVVGDTGRQLDDGLHALRACFGKWVNRSRSWTQRCTSAKLEPSSPWRASRTIEAAGHPLPPGSRCHPRSQSGRDHLDTERHQPHRPAGEPARAATQGGDDCRPDADNDGLAIDACGQGLQALTQLSEPGAGQGRGCLADAWSGCRIRFESHRQSNTGPCSAARLCSSSQSFEPLSATYSRREPAS